MSRHTTAAGSHPTVEERAPRSGEVGWPAPPNKGQGLGWPGDLSADGREQPAEPAPRGRGGRRLLFGTAPAA